MNLPFADELILVNLAYGALIGLGLNVLSNSIKLTNEFSLPFIGIVAVGYAFLRLKDVI